jgi:hypothetical protein
MLQAPSSALPALKTLQQKERPFHTAAAAANRAGCLSTRPAKRKTQLAATPHLPARGARAARPAPAACHTAAAMMPGCDTSAEPQQALHTKHSGNITAQMKSTPAGTTTHCTVPYFWTHSNFLPARCARAARPALSKCQPAAGSPSPPGCAPTAASSPPPSQQQWWRQHSHRTGPAARQQQPGCAA